MRALAASAVLSAMAATAAVAGTDLGAVIGRALFARNWTSAPASTDSTDGLGPLFNARSCAGCHSGPALGARFAEHEGKISGRGLVIRFGDQAGQPDPIYGRLLQVEAVQGLQPEGRFALESMRSGKGGELSLDLGRGALAEGVHASARIAPPLVGRAGLDLIDIDAVLALADPDDDDADGISGRARWVTEDGVRKLGRYGWKAGIGSLEGQVADAFAHDLGLSSSLLPRPHGDCTEREPDCLDAPSGSSDLNDGHEVSDAMIAAVVAFLRERGAAPASDTMGSAIFDEVGCAACHAPSLPRAGGGSVTAFTDLLLHEMGSGLDDRVGEPGVASSEWRTAPLAGLAAGSDRRYLHDGRAEDLDSAIGMHAGEASAARSRYQQLTEGDRRTLLTFLEGL